MELSYRYIQCTDNSNILIIYHLQKVNFIIKDNIHLADESDQLWTWVTSGYIRLRSWLTGLCRHS